MLRRLRLSRQLELLENGALMIHPSVELKVSQTAKIRVGGKVALGASLHGAKPFAKRASVFYVEDEAEVTFHGDVVIAPGFTIQVLRGAKLSFGGQNHFDSNLFLRCSKEVEVGEQVYASWNVVLMDSDGHAFWSSAYERAVDIPARPLSIGRNAGLQMNVIIPSGVTIGESSIVAAGTILRENVPDRSVVYSSAKLKIKPSFCRPEP